MGNIMVGKRYQPGFAKVVKFDLQDWPVNGLNSRLSDINMSNFRYKVIYIILIYY